MMQKEFEDLIEENISPDVYEMIIEPVYMYYPNMTKDIAAELYKTFGIVIFKDMILRAKKIKKAEETIRTAEVQIKKLASGEWLGD